jgi:hypothetical protein
MKPKPNYRLVYSQFGNYWICMKTISKHRFEVVAFTI